MPNLKKKEEKEKTFLGPEDAIPGFRFSSKKFSLLSCIRRNKNRASVCRKLQQSKHRLRKFVTRSERLLLIHL